MKSAILAPLIVMLLVPLAADAAEATAEPRRSGEAAAKAGLISWKDLEAYNRVRKFLETPVKKIDTDYLRNAYRGSLQPDPGGVSPITLKNYQPPPEIPKYGFQRPELKLRQSFADVLEEENPSLKLPEGANRWEDLKGAAFSYTRDRKSNEDVWAAKAALILPLVWILDEGLRPQTSMDRARIADAPEPLREPGEMPTEHRALLRPIALGLMPSVGINRVTGKAGGEDAGAESEADSVLYRLGLFGTFVTSNPVLHTVIFRGAAQWETDTAHEKSTPALEVEVEPKFFFKLGQVPIGVGDRFNLKNRGGDFDKAKEYGPPPWLAYQARLRGRVISGRVEKTTIPGIEEGADFLRGGFVAELQLNPFILPQVIVSVAYSYLPKLAGVGEHDTLFEASLEYAILDDPDERRRLGVKAGYTKGFSDLPGLEQTDQFVIGLTALF